MLRSGHKATRGYILSADGCCLGRFGITDEKQPLQILRPPQHKPPANMPRLRRPHSANPNSYTATATTAVGNTMPIGSNATLQLNIGTLAEPVWEDVSLLPPDSITFRGATMGAKAPQQMPENIDTSADRPVSPPPPRKRNDLPNIGNSPGMLQIGFQLPEHSSDDIKLITLLGKSLEMFKHLPPKHLRAAIKWFSDYADTKIDEYQTPPE